MVECAASSLVLILTSQRRVLAPNSTAQKGFSSSSISTSQVVPLIKSHGQVQSELIISPTAERRFLRRVPNVSRHHVSQQVGHQIGPALLVRPLPWAFRKQDWCPRATGGGDPIEESESDGLWPYVGWELNLSPPAQTEVDRRSESTPLMLERSAATRRCRSGPVAIGRASVLGLGGHRGPDSYRELLVVVTAYPFGSEEMSHIGGTFRHGRPLAAIFTSTPPLDKSIERRGRAGPGDRFQPHGKPIG